MELKEQLELQAVNQANIETLTQQLSDLHRNSLVLVGRIQALESAPAPKPPPKPKPKKRRIVGSK